MDHVRRPDGTVLHRPAGPTGVVDRAVAGVGADVVGATAVGEGDQASWGRLGGGGAPGASSRICATGRRRR